MSFALDPRQSSKSIALDILKSVLTFYAVYYVVCSICFASYELDNFDGRIPFDFDTWIHLPDCCSKYNSQEIVNFLSMLLTFAVSGVVFGVVLKQNVWDYSLTVTLLHTLLSCLVMLSFPLKWSWWVCLGFAVLLMISFGELISLALRVRSRAKVSIHPSMESDHTDFLYRKS